MDSVVIDGQELIAVRNLSFGYKESLLLSNIGLSVFKGDFLAIIGPNGSGKTTLIKIVLGLLTPAAGEVYLMGKPVSRFKNWHQIGYIPQKATHIDPLFPASVREVVAMALFANRKTPGLTKKQRETAIRDALRQVGMEEHLRRPIANLSAGQQQRVFIARALVPKPKILVLDEPTTGVDADTQDRFYEMLGKLNREEDITIVLITHDIGIVNKHIRQVACLNQRLIYHGSHDDFCRSNALREMLAGGHHLISHGH